MFLPKPYQLVLCLNLIKPQLTMLITLKKVIIWDLIV